MNTSSRKRTFQIRPLLALFSVICLLALSASAIAPSETSSVILAAGADAGVDYLDSMIFFGESTTAHLRARGVLTGGTETTRVWSDSSGTKTLSRRLLQEPIVYPSTGEPMTLEEALKREQPTLLVLSFGLNNITAFASDTELYISHYKRLIDLVQEASPRTRILLQTVYPVSLHPASFSMDGVALCRLIDRLNATLPQVASAYSNVRVVDTASVLKDPDTGLLSSAYAMEDGVHLTAEAYRQILYYLRTHPWAE